MSPRAIRASVVSMAEVCTFRAQKGAPIALLLQSSHVALTAFLTARDILGSHRLRRERQPRDGAWKRCHQC